MTMTSTAAWRNWQSKEAGGGGWGAGLHAGPLDGRWSRPSARAVPTGRPHGGGGVAPLPEGCAVLHPTFQEAPSVSAGDVAAALLPRLRRDEGWLLPGFSIEAAVGLGRCPSSALGGCAADGRELAFPEAGAPGAQVTGKGRW